MTTAISFSRQNDLGSLSRALCLLQNLILVIVLEFKGFLFFHKRALNMRTQIANSARYEHAGNCFKKNSHKISMNIADLVTFAFLDDAYSTRPIFMGQGMAWPLNQSKLWDCITRLSSF